MPCTAFCLFIIRFHTHAHTTAIRCCRALTLSLVRRGRMLWPPEKETKERDDRRKTTQNTRTHTRIHTKNKRAQHTEKKLCFWLCRKNKCNSRLLGHWRRAQRRFLHSASLSIVGVLVFLFYLFIFISFRFFFFFFLVFLSSFIFGCATPCHIHISFVSDSGFFFSTILDGRNLTQEYFHLNKCVSFLGLYFGEQRQLCSSMRCFSVGSFRFLGFSWKRPWHFGCFVTWINSIHQFHFEITFLIKIFFPFCLFVTARNTLMSLCVLCVATVFVCSYVIYIEH